MTRVMVDMSATLIHHGHVNLLRHAAQFGEVIVGLTTDDQIQSCKGYQPELSYAERKIILEAFEMVMEVVPTPWLITDELLEQHKIDLLFHGADNSNSVDPEKLRVLPRTEGISSTKLRQRAQASLIDIQNQKLMLTPGPAGILNENIEQLKPLFGRGDKEYQVISKAVISWIKKLSGQDEVVAAQGSATLALEMAAKAFVGGKVLLLSTGYYSDRLMQLLPAGCQVTKVDYAGLAQVNGQFDWLLCAYTETSKGFKVDLSQVKDKANMLGARLYVDATGSIGLEDHHELGDVLAFSSCKGLFGLTGACFVAYKDDLPVNNGSGFYSRIETHKQQLVTGPYHAMASLYGVISMHSVFKARVIESKESVLAEHARFIERSSHQPMLSTYLSAEVSAIDDQVVLYQPRSNLPGSIVCHLGEIHKTSVNLLDRIQAKPLAINS